MAIMTIMKEVKEVHPESIALVKVGKFYNAYGKDSYILSYMFGYKLKKVEGISSVGFPLEALNKVKANLENKKIDYILLDRRNNYDVDEISENKNLNTYAPTFKKAKEYINSKEKVENIYQTLLKNLNNKKMIDEVEKVLINERRKV